jgi:hypothetical protein
MMASPVSAFRKYRGKRVVECPETQAPAGVEVDAGHAALTAVLGKPDLRLKECSRWPERQNCGQDCLAQIALAPEDCLVRTMLAKWYVGKSCVFCARDCSEIDWMEHRPTLLGPDGRTVEWQDVASEDLPGVLETHKAVCWNCHVAETFRRQHPDLVIDNPWQRPVRDE